MIHSNLVELAKQDLIRIGCVNIVILDGVHTGRKSPWKKPIPDIVAELGGKRLAVECGYLANVNRFAQLKKAGYEIIIYYPYLEVFDLTMTLPQKESEGFRYRNKPSV